MLPPVSWGSSFTLVSGSQSGIPYTPTPLYGHYLSSPVYLSCQRSAFLVLEGHEGSVWPLVRHWARRRVTQDRSQRQVAEKEGAKTMLAKDCRFIQHEHSHSHRGAGAPSHSALQDDRARSHVEPPPESSQFYLPPVIVPERRQ